MTDSNNDNQIYFFPVEPRELTRAELDQAVRDNLAPCTLSRVDDWEYCAQVDQMLLENEREDKARKAAQYKLLMRLNEAAMKLLDGQADRFAAKMKKIAIGNCDARFAWLLATVDAALAEAESLLEWENEVVCDEERDDAHREVLAELEHIIDGLNQASRAAHAIMAQNFESWE
jgi:hypothetical protein